MATVSIARRYARALLEAESQSGLMARSADQLWELGQLVKGSSELQSVFANPSFSRAQRMAVTDQLLKVFGDVSPALAGTVRLLVSRDRALLLADVARLFRDMVDAREGRVRGEVTTAVPLSEEGLARMEQALERAVQRDVILQAKVDPAMIGGVSARVGSVAFDGSLRSQLEELRAQLKRA